MVQDPFKVDQLQIRPEAALPIVVNDIGVAVFALATLLTVGVGGVGAAYTTIQAALDAIPATSSPTNPYVVLVGPGLYTETVNIVRDGVFIIAYGATLQSLVEATPNGPGAYHTLVIQSGLGTNPENVCIQGLTITNAHDSFACVRIAGAAASLVGSGGIKLLDCNLKATAAGGNRPIWADSVNNIFMQGGSMTGSSAIALVFAEECARVVLDHVLDVTGFQLDYDTGGVLPSVGGSSYQLNGCLGLAANSTLAPPLNSALVGAGSLQLTGCSGGADLTMGGDRTLDVQGSVLGNLVLNGTVAATLVGSSRGTAVGATATLAEPVQEGSVTFAAASSMPVVLSPAHPDTSYQVSFMLLGASSGEEVPWVTAKTAGGFTINFTSAQSLSLEWSVSRRV
jgi:hypothetical protein